MGSFRKVSTEGGGGSIGLGKVLPHSGTSGAAIWVIDLGDVVYTVEKLKGVHVGFLRKVTGKKARR